jgi:hypothetical protein
MAVIAEFVAGNRTIEVKPMDPDPTQPLPFRIAPIVPDLGTAETIFGFWEWCKRLREGLRQFRLRLGEPEPTQLAVDEFRVIPEIVRQCRKLLRGFGAQGIPESFTFSHLPLDQEESAFSHMDRFLAWASCYRSPGHEIMKLMGDVEDFLTWAMAWCVRNETLTSSISVAERPDESKETLITLDSAKAVDQLRPASRNAYRSFQYAESKKGEVLTDRAAYAVLKEDGIEESASDFAELADYKLPSFDTWSRHLRTARKQSGNNKYRQRPGKPEGRSIARPDQIEPRKKAS